MQRDGFILLQGRRQRLKRGGFTLIELLVVIAIISILMGLILSALATARRVSKERKVQGDLILIAAALDRYQQDFQDYPPSDGDTDGIKGSENLLKCLKTEKKGGPYLTDPSTRTVDSNNNGALELADEWNHPILYIHHRDYANKAPNKHTYRLMSAGPNGEFENGAKNSDDIVNWNKDKPE